MRTQQLAATRTIKHRVFVVDDHSVVRQGVVWVLDGESDIEVCGEAGDAPQALDGITRTEPDIAIIDISLPGRDGLDLIKDLRAIGDRFRGRESGRRS